MSWESLRVKRDERGSPFPLRTKPGEGAYVHAAAMALKEPVREVYWRMKSLDEERLLRRGIAPARLHGVVLARNGMDEGEASRIAEGVLLDTIARRRAQSEALDGIVDPSESEALLAESISRFERKRMDTSRSLRPLAMALSDSEIGDAIFWPAIEDGTERRIAYLIRWAISHGVDFEPARARRDLALWESHEEVRRLWADEWVLAALQDSPRERG